MALLLQSFKMINQQRQINAHNASLLKGTLTFFSHCNCFMYLWIFKHQTKSKIQYYLNYKIHRISVVIFLQPIIQPNMLDVNDLFNDQTLS